MRDDDPDSVEPEKATDIVAAIHEHLDATAELPVEPTASTYLGEAAAVAADAHAATRDGQHEAARTRVEQVRELLSHVDGTGNDAADDHVDAAARLADTFLAAETRDQDG